MYCATKSREVLCFNLYAKLRSSFILFQDDVSFPMRVKDNMVCHLQQYSSIFEKNSHIYFTQCLFFSILWHCPTIFTVPLDTLTDFRNKSAKHAIIIVRALYTVSFRTCFLNNYCSTLHLFSQAKKRGLKMSTEEGWTAG